MASRLQGAGIVNLRWHDLRHEYASRLVEKGVPLSQVRDLLGHASIVTTERYDNQKPEALMAAAKRLETGETTILQVPTLTLLARILISTPTLTITH